MNRVRYTIFAALLVVLLLVPDLGAQQLAAPYVLGPGDVISVTVFGYPDLSRTVTVMPDGRVSLALVGIIRVAGLTLDRLTQILTRAYATYIRSPQISVVVTDFRKITVTILGEVARPGTYALLPGATLFELIVLAGGLKDEANLEAADLVRPGRVPVTVNLQKVMSGDSQENSTLQGGETLIVRKDLINFVIIMGQVSRPGRYHLTSQNRLLDLLLSAGGLSEKASLTDAVVVRATGEREPLALDRLLLKQDMSANAILRPGDTVFIPEDLTSIYFIIGDVRTVGQFPLRGEVTILQAIAAAGGVVQRNILSARTVHILRRSGTQDRVPAGVKLERLSDGRVFLTLDLSAIQRGDTSGSMLIYSRDIIVVPQHDLISLQGILSVLGGLLNFLVPR